MNLLPAWARNVGRLRLHMDTSGKLPLPRLDSRGVFGGAKPVVAPSFVGVTAAGDDADWHDFADIDLNAKTLETHPASDFALSEHIHEGGGGGGSLVVIDSSVVTLGDDVIIIGVV